jgi:hypothetical protein
MCSLKCGTIVDTGTSVAYTEVSTGTSVAYTEFLPDLMLVGM